MFFVTIKAGNSDTSKSGLWMQYLWKPLGIELLFDTWFTFLDKFNCKLVWFDFHLFHRSQDFARVELQYLVLKTRLTVMSSWGTSLCIECALPWPASSFCSVPSWFVYVAVKTHVQLFKMGENLFFFFFFKLWKNGFREGGMCTVLLLYLFCANGKFVNLQVLVL